MVEEAQAEAISVLVVSAGAWGFDVSVSVCLWK